MDHFEDDDDGYLTWLQAHPRGYVVNSSRPPSPAYLILHMAACHTINGTPANGKSWTRDYGKYCSAERGEIVAWATATVGGHLRSCGLCSPRLGS